MNYTGATLALTVTGMFVIWQGNTQADELARQASADTSAVRSMIAGKSIQQLYGLLQHCDEPQSYRLTNVPSAGHCAEVWRAIGSEDIQLVGVQASRRLVSYSPSGSDYSLLR